MKWLAVALPLLLAAGCSASGSAGGSSPSATGTGDWNGSGSGGSSSAGTGGVSGGCNTDGCLLATSAVWDVQVDPPSSSSYAMTQVLAKDVSVDASFEVALATPVSVTLNAAAHGGMVPASANVVVTVPPLLPGRPDLVYQAPASIDGTGTSAMATVAITADALGGPASVSLVPLPPADGQMPAYSFSMMLGAANTVTLPEGDVLVSGQVINAVQGTVNAQFVARAFQNGLLVSDAPLTQKDGTSTDGTFQLRIPAAAAANPVTLDLRPTTAAPWVVSMPFSIVAGKNLGTISLPAYSSSNGFNIAVTSGDTGTALASVSVRAQAALGGTLGSSGISATAQYTASGTTNTDGNVVLQLLPGSTNAPLKYLLSVIPPPGSPYALTCDSVEVLGGSPPGSTTAPPTLPASKLARVGRRPVLIGVIRTSAGVAVPNATVTASGTPDMPAGCPAPDPVTATTSADANGTFQLPLDPGTYQLDYDPPATSNAPRMTELAVTVSADPGAHDVWLPRGAVVKGAVTGPGQVAVASATVRFFERRCNLQGTDCFGPNRTPPWLRGRALTDATGHFRMVVPIPSSP